ncbi:MAG: DUF177 domain-containing protein [Hyphomicrobium sp.]|nr:DUF177 domain-containing protein [Hyphomicrobium sp.]
MPSEIASPLDWTYAVVDLADGGIAKERAASASELAAIASMLGLLSLASLTASYRVNRLAGGGYRLAGRVIADLEQACVVTLDPVAQHMDEKFDVEFWAESKKNDTAAVMGQEASVLEGPDVEPLVDGKLTVGRIVFETISAALDPFPRKDDAAFDWRDPAAAEPGKTSPFAALSRLKDKS